MPDNTNNALDELYERYILHLLENRSPSDNTFMAYKRDLTKFMDFAHLSEYENFEEISSEDVSDYKDHLIKSGLSTPSVSRSLSALRSMYQFFMSEGLVTHNPAKEVHNDKSEKKGPSILTNKEIDILLSQPDPTDIKGKRDKAMLEVLYATGIKVSELVSLDFEDVNLSIPFIRVRNGDKERYIPIYKMAVKAVADYLDKARQLLIIDHNEKALFVNISGERLTRQGFWKILKSYAASAKINMDITPHTLRHSFAAHLLENGADLHDIQEILGHTDIASTQRYAQFLKTKVRKNYMKFHPRA